MLSNNQNKKKKSSKNRSTRTERHYSQEFDEPLDPEIIPLMNASSIKLLSVLNTDLSELENHQNALTITHNHDIIHNSTKDHTFFGKAKYKFNNDTGNHITLRASGPSAWVDLYQYLRDNRTPTDIQLELWGERKSPPLAIRGTGVYSTRSGKNHNQIVAKNWPGLAINLDQTAEDLARHVRKTRDRSFSQPQAHQLLAAVILKVYQGSGNEVYEALNLSEYTNIEALEDMISEYMVLTLGIETKRFEASHIDTLMHLELIASGEISGPGQKTRPYTFLNVYSGIRNTNTGLKQVYVLKSEEERSHDGFSINPNDYTLTYATKINNNEISKLSRGMSVLCSGNQYSTLKPFVYGPKGRKKNGGLYNKKNIQQLNEFVLKEDNHAQSRLWDSDGNRGASKMGCIRAYNLFSKFITAKGNPERVLEYGILRNTWAQLGNDKEQSRSLFSVLENENFETVLSTIGSESMNQNNSLNSNSPITFSPFKSRSNPNQITSNVSTNISSTFQNQNGSFGSQGGSYGSSIQLTSQSKVSMNRSLYTSIKKFKAPRKLDRSSSITNEKPYSVNDDIFASPKDINKQEKKIKSRRFARSTKRGVKFNKPFKSPLKKKSASESLKRRLEDTNPKEKQSIKQQKLYQQKFNSVKAAQNRDIVIHSHTYNYSIFDNVSLSGNSTENFNALLDKIASQSGNNWNAIFCRTGDDVVRSERINFTKESIRHVMEFMQNEKIDKASALELINDLSDKFNLFKVTKNDYKAIAEFSKELKGYEAYLEEANEHEEYSSMSISND